MSVSKKDKKRGSWLGPRPAASTSSDGSETLEVTPPAAEAKVGKTQTFGRSFGRLPSRSASLKEVSVVLPDSAPPARPLSPWATTSVPSAPSSGTASPAGSPSSRSSSAGWSDPPAALRASNKRTGMVGMAAAFDALITSEESQSSSPASTPEAAPPVPGDAESQLTALQERFDALEREHEALKLRCRALEARALEAEQAAGIVHVPGDGETLSPPSMRRSAPLSSSAPGSPSPAKSDAVKEEVARVRKEIKSKSQKLTLSLGARAPAEDAASGGGQASGPAAALRGGWDSMEEAAIERFERSWLSRLNTYLFGDWRFAQIPGRSLVAKADGFHIEAGDAVLDTLSPSGRYSLVEPHLNTSFYADFMANIKHVNLVGLSGIGAFADIPMVISVEQVSISRSTKLRRKPLLCMIRAPSGTEQLCFCGYDTPIAKLPYDATTFIGFLSQRFPGSNFSPVRAPEAAAQLQKSLLQFEAMNLVKTYKLGVLRWVNGQSENDAFQNGPSPAFTSFLEWLGERVELKGWTKFRGGLNVRDLNVTGSHSYYTTLGDDAEIMFHVSTELPYSETDAQCLERKRHLGNDVVIIVFWEGEGEFDPTVVKSQFNHVFIVVAVDASSIPELSKIRYRVTVTCKTGVPRWEPFLPSPAVFDRDEALRQWLLYKCVNGERAAMHAPVFRTKLIKTNTSYLKNLVDTFFTEDDAAEDLSQVKSL